MTEPMTEAGRRLLHFIDAAIENTTNGVSWRYGAGYARQCAGHSIPAIEAEAVAAALARVRERVATVLGPRCYGDGSDVCRVHGEVIWNGTCEDWDPHFDAVLAIIRGEAHDGE